MADTRHVIASYDPETGMWWAESEDLLGVVSQAPTLDALVDRVMAMVGELLEANGMPAAGVSVQIKITRQVEPA